MPFPVSDSLEVGSVIIQKVRLTSGIISLALIVAVILFIYKTMIGKSLLAMGQNSTGASLIGININSMAALAFGIGTGLAGAGAVLIAPVSYLFPGMAHSPLLKAFAIIIIGGMGSIPGAVLGGLLLGTAESFCVQYASASWAEVVAFAVLVFTLVVRPTGIFGREV
jgi:branched-chain amino acid transport system permease protein